MHLSDICWAISRNFYRVVSTGPTRRCCNCSQIVQFAVTRSWRWDWKMKSRHRLFKWAYTVLIMDCSRQWWNLFLNFTVHRVSVGEVRWVQLHPSIFEEDLICTHRFENFSYVNDRFIRIRKFLPHVAGVADIPLQNWPERMLIFFESLSKDIAIF